MGRQQIKIDDAVEYIVEEKIKDFPHISLKDTRSVGLLNRVDTKYIFHCSALPEILGLCTREYFITTESGQSRFPYYTIYFDTPAYTMFLAHHNGLGHRYKLRLREYVGFTTVYAEIKEKFKGKTNKHRILVTNHGTLDTCLYNRSKKREIDDFTRLYLPYDPEVLSQTLSIRFTRMTLVHTTKSERITIDTHLAYSMGRNHVNLPNLVVAEIKHQGAVPHQQFSHILHDLRIYPTRFSKYCMGMIHIDPSLKYNRFKNTLLQLERLPHE